MATFSQTGTDVRGGRLIAWVVAALWGLGAFWQPQLGGGGPRLAQAQREAPPSWDFFIDLPDLRRGLAEVTWTLRGFGPEHPLRVCGDMNDAERYVGRIERLEWNPASAVGEGSWGAGPGPGPQLRGGPGRQQLRRDGRCWRVPDADPRGVVLRYTYDLRELAARNGSPDYAQRLGETYIFNDETILLRPDPLPRGGGAPEPIIRVELRLPPGAQVAAPWQRQPGPGQRFVMDAAQYDGGGYVMVGTIEDLGEVRLPHTTVHVVTLPAERRLSAPALRSWVGSALSAVDRFYGSLTPRHVLVNLVPVPGSQDASLFGTVLRPLRPSVVIYFGADCERAENPDEWVAVHELFHIGNPWLTDRMPWFVEGFTTYYQDVLRARAGTVSATATWGDLWDGFRRLCQPEDGSSLREESARLRSSYRYTRVYWGGACVAFLADIAIRERSRGRQSLDDVMRELRVRSLREPLDEDEVLAALDEAAGGKQVSGFLRERRALPVRDRLQRLGVEVTGDDSVRLRDDAPLSALRRAMF